MTSAIARAVLSVADRGNIFMLSRRLRDRLHRSAEIVTYHRVGTVSPASDQAFLAGINVKRFEEQIALLARAYEIVPLGLLVECVREGKPWPRFALAVTLDDGYSDNYEYAFPVLRKHRVPATVFLTAGCIENRCALWWDKVHRTVMGCSNWPDANIMPERLYPKDVRTLWNACEASSTNSRIRLSEELVRQLTAVPDERRLAIVEDLPARVGADPSGGLEQDSLLSWAQVREMADGGIEFGAHTLTHPSLDRLSVAGLRREIEGSKKLIETRLGRPTDLFAYPGGFGAVCIDTRKALEAAGFRGAMTNRSGSNTLDADPFLLRRRSVPDEPVAVVAATIAGWFDSWRTAKSVLCFGSNS